MTSDQSLQKKVSIIVPVYNSERTIEKCIRSLLDLDYPKGKMEIIFVDSSADSTSKILSKYNSVNMKVLHQRRQGISSARNLGVINSTGEIIAFIDSDCFATRDWLRNLVGGFVGREIGGIGGRLSNDNPETELEKYMAKLTDNWQSHLKDSRPYLLTANAAYSRKAIETVGLFDKDLVTGEDADISWRVRNAGFKIIYEPSAIAYYKCRSTLYGMVIQQFYYGKGWAQLQLKYKIPVRIYKEISIESTRFFLFALKFFLRFTLYIFGKNQSAYAREPLYDFMREFSYSLGYIHGRIFYNSRYPYRHWER